MLGRPAPGRYPGVHAPHMDSQANDVTRLLDRVRGGDEAALERLVPLVYDELRLLARASFARQSGPMTLQATALVHEAWLKLSGQERRAYLERECAGDRALLEEAWALAELGNDEGGEERLFSDEEVQAARSRLEMLIPAPPVACDELPAPRPPSRWWGVTGGVIGVLGVAGWLFYATRARPGVPESAVPAMERPEPTAAVDEADPLQLASSLVDADRPWAALHALQQVPVSRRTPEWEQLADRLPRVLEGSGRCARPSFFGDGEKVVAHADGSRLVVWELAEPAAERTVFEDLDIVELSVAARDRVACVTRDGRVLVLDLARGVALRSWPTGAVDAGAGCLTLAPDGETIAFVDAAGSLHVVKAASERVRLDCPWPAARWSSVALAPDGARVAAAVGGAGSGDGVLVLVDARSAKELARVSDLEPVQSLSFGPDGTELAAGGRGWLQVFDGRTLGPTNAANAVECGAGIVWSIAHAPGAGRFATYSSDGRIRLFEAHTGELLFALDHGRGGRAGTLAFAPDGRRVLAPAPLSGLPWLVELE